jgi:hypothetical protein
MIAKGFIFIRKFETESNKVANKFIFTGNFQTESNINDLPDLFELNQI